MQLSNPLQKRTPVYVSPFVLCEPSAADISDKRTVDCHCHATPEPLDPSFTFRDHLLEFLITQESLVENQQELRFQYSALKGNEKLNATLALQAAETSSTNRTNLHVAQDRLLRGTIQALRDDGIIHLIHAPSDTYLFVSRHRVLEPARVKVHRPSFMRNPKVRLRLGLLSRLSNQTSDNDA